MTIVQEPFLLFPRFEMVPTFSFFHRHESLILYPIMEKCFKLGYMFSNMSHPDFSTRKHINQAFDFVKSLIDVLSG